MIEATWGNREIGRDGGQLKEGHDLHSCPACKAQNVFVAFSVPEIRDARKHVECRICKMQGPEQCSVADAVESWNELPRHDARALDLLQKFEMACEQIASARTREQYLSLIDDGQQALLEHLDEVRRAARNLLRTPP